MGLLDSVNDDLLVDDDNKEKINDGVVGGNFYEEYVITNCPYTDVEGNRFFSSTEGREGVFAICAELDKMAQMNGTGIFEDFGGVEGMVTNNDKYSIIMSPRVDGMACPKTWYLYFHELGHATMESAVDSKEEHFKDEVACDIFALQIMGEDAIDGFENAVASAKSLMKNGNCIINEDEYEILERRLKAMKIYNRFGKLPDGVDGGFIKEKSKNL